MTVQELVEKLSELPEDAIVMLKHQLIGDEQYAKTVAYKKDDIHDPKHGVVWIGETYD